MLLQIQHRGLAERLGAAFALLLASRVFALGGAPEHLLRLFASISQPELRVGPDRVASFCAFVPVEADPTAMPAAGDAQAKARDGLVKKFDAPLRWRGQRADRAGDKVDGRHCGILPFQLLGYHRGTAKSEPS